MKRTREQYEEDVWKTVDKIPVPSWVEKYQKGSKKVSNKNNVRRSVGLTVRTRRRTKAKPVKKLDFAKENNAQDVEGSERLRSNTIILEKIDQISRTITKSGSRKKFARFRIAFRVSLELRRILIELVELLGVSQSEILRMALVAFYAMIKKERLLWQ